MDTMHIESTQSFSQAKSTVNQLLRMYIDDKQVLSEFSNAKDWCSEEYIASSYLLPFNKDRVSNTTNISANVTNFYTQSTDNFSSLFSQNETCVYMTLCSTGNHCKNSETQATAAINKCLQVRSDNIQSITCVPSNMEVDNGLNWWSCNSSTTANNNNKSIESSLCEDIPLYFMGLRRANAKYKSSTQSTEVGSNKPWPKKRDYNTQISGSDKGSDKGSGHESRQSQSTEMSKKTAIWCQTSSCKPTSHTQLVTTVSHVKKKPLRPCPVYDREPSTGPKCNVNYPPTDDEKAPVIVTTGANPRRGVFEIVIRRLNGAPLAKNELILEWTPPASIPCGGPCPLPCFLPNTCRPTKCTTMICRTQPCKPSKCCMKICKRPYSPKPCGPVPCGPLPCGPMACGPMPCGGICPRKCYRPPRRPNPPQLYLPVCQSSLPGPCLPWACPPRPCPPRLCPPRLCRLPRTCLTPPCCDRPCQSSPCSGYPCPSTPCFRLCPVGKCRRWKKNRKPKIKKHRKHISPCLNRADCCPVVSCRSMPPGCGRCASCSAGKSCGPCVKFPFKPRCCKSACTNCC